MSKLNDVQEPSDYLDDEDYGVSKRTMNRGHSVVNSAITGAFQGGLIAGPAGALLGGLLGGAGQAIQNALDEKD